MPPVCRHFYWGGVVAAFLGTALLATAQTPVNHNWSVDEMLAAIELRGRQLVTHDVTLIFCQSPGPDLDRYQLARRRAAEALSKALRVPVPQPPRGEADSEVTSVTQTIRQWRANGNERFEVEQAPPTRDGQRQERIKQVFVYDGDNWKTLLADKGSVQNGVGFLKPGFYLGIDFDWDYPGLAVKHRSLGGTLRAAQRGGYLENAVASVGKNARLLEIIARFPTSNEDLNRAGCKMQSAIQFDPMLGMAPVSFRATMVYKEGDLFKPTLPPVERVGIWSGYHKLDGIWLPKRFLLTYYQSVMLPKQGETFPGDFDLTKISNAAQFDRMAKFESFAVSQTAVDVKTLAVNEPIPPNRFALAFPSGTLVYDETKDKAFQVGTVNPDIEKQLKGALTQRNTTVARSQPVSPWRRWLLWFNISALLLAFAWVFRRRLLGPFMRDDS